MNVNPELIFKIGSMNNMNEIIRRFLNLKLRTKMFLSYLLIIMMVILVNYMIYDIYESNSIKNTELYSISMVEQLSNNISNLMTSFDTDILYATGAAKLFEERDFSDYLIMMKDVYVFNIYLQNSGIPIVNDLFMNASGSMFYYNKNNSNDRVDSNIYSYIRLHKKSILAASGRSLYVEFDNEPGILYIVKSNITLNTHLSNGILAIGISDKVIKNLFSQANLQNGSIVICDQNSKILMCDENIKPIINQFHNILPENTSGKNFFNYKGEHLIIENGVSDNGRWKVLYVISLKVLLKEVQNIKQLVILLCVILLAFSMAFALVISGTLTSNIRLLLKKIRSVEQGDFSLKLEPKNHDETAELFSHFNRMSAKLDTLIERSAYEKTETQRAEYNALLAQINPHFIFNLLESINGIAKIKGQDEIVQIISSSSFLIRISISGTNSEVTLRDELNYINKYISIQQIITGGRIHVEFDVDEDTLDHFVPKLILQPIIENAINYGIEYTKSVGLILVSAHKEKDVLKINISDDGKGIEAEKLKDIISSLEQPVQVSGDMHPHIGIKSVNTRIKILYGNKFGLKITSRLEEGTAVELNLPIK